MHPDGYIQLKDRSKDIIISGGENISSIEVEDVLYKHPAVAAAAVVAKPDRNGARRRAPSSSSGRARQPRRRRSSPGAARSSPATNARAASVFVELPKTSTGKIQKFKLRDMAKDE